MRILRLISKREISYLTLTVVIVLILIGSGLIFYNQQAIKETLALQKQTEAVRIEMSLGYDQAVRDVDVSLRGYAIIREKRFLYVNSESIRSMAKASFHRLDSLLARQNYRDPEGLKDIENFKKAILDYIDYHQFMVDLLEKDSIDTFNKIFAEDRGEYTLWPPYQKAREKITKFEDALYQQAKIRYEFAMQSNIVVQLLMIFVGIPVIIVVMRKLHRENRQRQILLKQLEENNYTYLFNPGAAVENQSAEQIIGHSIANLQKSSDFVARITTGDYEVNWEEMNSQNRSLNENNLAGRLVKMRDQMKKVKQEDATRVWASEGLARFSALVRNNQHNLQSLSEEAVRFLTKHLGAQQGSLFVVENHNEETCLKLSACYAFDRKKFLEKRIDIGDGLIGQTYLEGDTVLLTDIPQGYTTITSGLGDATPTCLVIVPMKYNDTTQAVLELAGFSVFESYQVGFLEKCGEFIASALLSVHATEQMKTVLEQSQQRTEELRAQEEEMRQNMEEMQAIQEQQARLEKELKEKLEELEKTRNQVEQVRLTEKARADEQIEKRNQIMKQTMEKFKQKEQELLAQIEQQNQELLTLKNG